MSTNIEYKVQTNSKSQSTTKTNNSATTTSTHRYKDVAILEEHNSG